MVASKGNSMTGEEGCGISTKVVTLISSLTRSPYNNDISSVLMFPRQSLFEKKKKTGLIGN